MGIGLISYVVVNSAIYEVLYCFDRYYKVKYYFTNSGISMIDDLYYGVGITIHRFGEFITLVSVNNGMKSEKVMGISIIGLKELFEDNSNKVDYAEKIYRYWVIGELDKAVNTFSRYDDDNSDVFEIDNVCGLFWLL